MNEVSTGMNRQKLLDMQAEMLAREERVECPVRHFFSNGRYMREMLIPKGTLIVGKLHRHAHLNNISVGHVQVFTEDGLVEYKAPHAFMSKVGTKRLVLALEDTVWTTYHENPDDLRDLQQLEAQIIAPSYEQLGAPDDMGISGSGRSIARIGCSLGERSEQEG